jgi:FkbM family methyltransferase
MAGGMMHKCAPTCGACNKDGYERRDIDFLKAHATKDSVFFDVGAHAGLYTAELAPLVKQVIAVEPVTTDLLYSNVGHLANVVIVDACAWHKSENVGIEPRSNGQSFATGSGHVSAFEMDVFGWTAFQGPRHKRLLFKIDVEGAAVNVLMGLKQTLGRAKEIAGVIEVDENHMTRFNSNPTQIGDHLHGLVCVSSQTKNHHFTKGI